MSNRPTPEAIERKEVTESSTCDFKREFDLDDPNKRHDFINDVVAFLNADGGYLIVGVDEGKKGKPVTFKPLTGSKDDISLRATNILLDNIDPRPLGIKVDAVDIPGGFLLYVEISNRNSDKPYCNKNTGTYKRRVGSRNVALLPQEVAALLKPREALHTQVKSLAKDEYAKLRETGILTLDCPELHIAILPLEHFNHDFASFEPNERAFVRKAFLGFHGDQDVYRRVPDGFEVRQRDLNGNVIGRFFVGDTWLIHSVACYPIQMQEGRGNIAFGTMETQFQSHLRNIAYFIEAEGLHGPFAVDIRMVNLWATEHFDRLFPRGREITFGRTFHMTAFNPDELTLKMVGRTREATVFGS